MSRTRARRFNSNGSSAVWPSSSDQASTVSLGATALICRFFRRFSEEPKGRYADVEKMFPGLGTHFKQGALCNSDSDLLPPRSRYPFKWARNRQPSPPPVALPGPLLSGAQQHQRLNGRLSEPLASG